MNRSFLSGQWQSNYHALSIQFNENVWRLIEDGFDNEERCLFGLFSENDGASFSLDLTLKDPALHYDTDFAEAEFFARMFNMDNHCQRLGTINLLIDDVPFIADRYQFMNSKYGNQMVTRAMHIDTTFVIAIGMAWPLDMHLEERFPIKFNHLIASIQLPK